MLGLLPPSAAPAAPSGWGGPAAAGRAELDAQWAEIAPPGSPTAPIRGTFRFALESAALGWRPERVDAALELARSMQDRDPASPTYGNFKWRRDHARVFDRNAVEFSLQQAALLRLRHFRALDPAGRALLDDLLAVGLEGVRRHEVRPEYTNIFLMKTWNLVAVGEALGRPADAEQGYRQWEQWLRFTAGSGLAEYGAVTYYGVDLDSLALLEKFAGRAAVRRQAGTVLRYFWTDIAANWWAPGDRLGGANARSYDYLYGRGYLEAHTWSAGWLRRRPELEGAGWLSGPRDGLAAFYDACAWIPPPALTDPIRATVPRVVVQRWGSAAGQSAVHYVGRRVALGTSGCSHGADERTLVGDLGDSPELPQVVLFMDGRGDSYGTRKTENAASQAKALHLTPFIASVQRGGEALQALSDDPLGPGSRRKAAEVPMLLSRLIFPSAAEVWLDEEPVPASARVGVDPGRALFLRLGDAAIGVRLLLARACDGGAAPIALGAAETDLPARCLTVAHAQGSPQGRGTLVAWVRAADGLDARGFAAFRRDFESAPGRAELAGGLLRAEAQGWRGRMALEADLAAGRRLRLEGGEPDALLAINGRDAGREFFDHGGLR